MISTVIAVLDDILQHRHRRLRADRDAGLGAERADVREQALRVRRRFEMKRDAVAPALRKSST